MSFTNVDVGFTERRYSFDGPDFGSLELNDVVAADVFDRARSCATCGLGGEDALCVACADFESVVGRVDDEPGEPDLEKDDEDEEEDDDTESEKAWVSSPGIRF
jgi:hypothetical protein